jgi:hypothetical protein
MCTSLFSGSLEERNHLGDLDINKKVTLIYTSKTGYQIWTGLM